MKLYFCDESFQDSLYGSIIGGLRKEQRIDRLIIAVKKAESVKVSKKLLEELIEMIRRTPYYA